MAERIKKRPLGKRFPRAGNDRNAVNALGNALPKITAPNYENNDTEPKPRDQNIPNVDVNTIFVRTRLRRGSSII